MTFRVLGWEGRRIRKGTRTRSRTRKTRIRTSTRRRGRRLPLGRIDHASVSSVGDPGIAPGNPWSSPTSNLKRALQLLSCQMPRVKESVLGLVGPVLVCYFHTLSHRLCPSTARCSPPLMPSIVFCLLLSCSRWFPPSLLCHLPAFYFVVPLISSLS